MLASRVFGVCVVSAAMLVAGCSSDSNPGGPPTTSATRTTTVGAAIGVPGGDTSPLHADLNLGSCPKTYPNLPLTKLNAGVAGLKGRLVPIAATAARICTWGARDIYSDSGEEARTVPNRLVAFATRTSRTAQDFEDLTNRQPRGTAGPMGCTGPNGGIRYEYLLLTFTNGSSVVDVEEVDGPCLGPQLSNGELLALPSPAWLNELHRLTTTAEVAVPDVLGDCGSSAVSELSGLRFVVAPTGARCCVAPIVMGQNPKAGALVPSRTTVTLTLTRSGLSAQGPTG